MAPLLPMEPLRLSRTNAWISRPPAPGDNPLEAVVQGLRDTQGQGSAAEQASPLVVQRGGGKSERAVAGDFPPLLSTTPSWRRSKVPGVAIRP